MNKVYLLMGGNIGNRQKYLQQATGLLQEYAGNISGQSTIYETAAWGKTDQQAFLNQAILLETDLAPLALLEKLLWIEESMDRRRVEKYGPRTIDIDIIFFNDYSIYQPNLIIPHPEIQNRRFVLAPLDEIASNYLHPVLNKTVHELLLECPDELPVNKY